MIFGTVFTGQIKTQDKQYIETKMFCLIVPIYVVNSMLVTEVVANGRKGIELKKNSLSIMAAIIRPIISIALFFSVGAYIGNYDTMPWLIAPLIFTLGLFVYFWFYFGRTTAYEKFIRLQFAKELGLYIFPKWLKQQQARTFFEQLKKQYLVKNSTENWVEKINTVPYYSEEFSLAFCLAALENYLNPDIEKEQLFIKIYEQSQ
jgi:hypothetical protein